MRLEHSFTVPVPVDTAWQVLLDLPRVAPCLPGATLTGVDGATFTGTVRVKLGPITLTYQGKGRFVERDEAAHRVVIEASGRDTRSAGTAAATVTALLAPDGDATRCEVGTDLTVTGRPAQFGRGMIAEVSAKLVGQFADCLAETLTGPSTAPAATTDPATTDPAAGPPPVVAPGTEAPRAQARPIDLLGIAGSTATARRLAGYGVGALVLILIWLVLRRRHRDS